MSRATRDLYRRAGDSISTQPPDLSGPTRSGEPECRPADILLAIAEVAGESRHISDGVRSIDGCVHFVVRGGQISAALTPAVESVLAVDRSSCMEHDGEKETKAAD